MHGESRKMVLMNLFAGQEQRTDLWAELGKENMGQTEGSTDVRAL